MTDKELINQEIKRLKQINGYLPVENYDLHAAYRARGYQCACDDILQFIDSLPEESTSEDLEEAALKYRWEHPFCDGYTAYSFKAGAEWHKQAMKDVLQTEYEKGRFDMREEMMKGAVDATVHKRLYSKYIKERDYESLSKALENFEEHDRVKIIIVKED